MKEQPLRRAMVPILESSGLELEAIELVPAGKRTLVRVIVDGDGATGLGVTLDEIAGVSKLLSSALDDTPEVGARPYTLEVSSRGVSRPLTKPAHWRRNRGRLVSVDFVGDRPSVTGRIVDTTQDGATLSVESAEEHIAWEEVAKALIQVELNRPARADDESLSEEG